MIAFGAVLGRSSPGQLLWMLVIMVGRSPGAFPLLAAAIAWHGISSSFKRALTASAQPFGLGTCTACHTCLGAHLRATPARLSCSLSGRHDRPQRFACGTCASASPAPRRDISIGHPPLPGPTPTPLPPPHTTPTTITTRTHTALAPCPLSCVLCPARPPPAGPQVPIYAVNAWLVFDQFKALDIGGSMSIHAFGAYYGLAASRWIATMPGGGTGHPLNGAVAVADTTAMIGTIFLWVLWPRCVGWAASHGGGGG